jgi:hypothetical protein
MTANKQQGHVKYFADQFDDEEVIFLFRKHPVVMRRGLIYGLIGPVLGVLPAALHPSLGMNGFFEGLAAGSFLGVIVFFPYWIGWHFSVFIITDQRFIQIKQKGLFTRSVSDLGLRQIQAVNYDVSGIQETLLGFGTITMRTYVGDVVIHDVHHPAKIQKKIVGTLRDLGITAANFAVGTASEEVYEETKEA